MPYVLAVKTDPGKKLSLAEILVLRSAVEPKIADAIVFDLSGPEDSDISAETLTDMLADQEETRRNFASYCAQFGVETHLKGGTPNPIAALGFLETLWGQEIITIRFPHRGSPTAIYFEFIAFARLHDFRLWSPMPGVGYVDLDNPGEVPPHWDRYMPDD